LIVGKRLRLLRQEKKLSQVEVEKRTGLHCCYISRVEHGHTVPAVETLEKFARALEVPMYQLFYEGGYPPELPHLPKRKRVNGSGNGAEWGSKGKDARLVAKFCRLFSRMEKDDLALVILTAQRLANRKAD
jgi:transcriptional regulator with XRE-family HTH domain